MITAENLTKSYRGVPVVHDITFQCAPGTITGFLGPNGAGKSTTLRMLTGLTQPDRGTSTVAGRPYVDLPNPLTTVGTLLDPSAMHPGRSGAASLALAARLAGIDVGGVTEALRRVGLSAAAGRRRVGTYSLGMRQRLGIALALIGNPQVLILDEPANGLDPEGIAWMRRLLRDFADRGGTVLLSSHLLAEVQATVDHLVVVAGGRIAAAGPLHELLAAGGVVVRTPDPAALTAALDARDISHHRSDDALLVDAAAEDVARLALDSRVLVTELRANDGGLEDLFFSLTADATAA